MPVTSRGSGQDERSALLPAEILPLFDDAFVRSCDLYEEYVFRLALDVFRRVGLAAACATPATVAQAVARASLAPHAANVPVEWILRTLGERGVLEVRVEDDDVRYLFAGDPGALGAEDVRLEQERCDPTVLPSYTIAELAAEHYPAVLRGEITGEQALFGATRTAAWAEYFSGGNALYAINNLVGAVACDAAIPAEGGAVLELGGGFGSGAAALCERLADRGRTGAVSSYRFTELSIPFLRQAQRSLPARRPEVPFSFARLDMNRPFREAGVEPGAYAIVYAVNALHVAHDLGGTLGEIREALRPDGSLVVAECVRPFVAHPVYVEFVFNLLEAFRSPRLMPGWRPNGGFLTPEQWRAALEANGFRDVRFLPDIEAIRDAYPSFVVAAISARRG